MEKVIGIFKRPSRTYILDKDKGEVFELQQQRRRTAAETNTIKEFQEEVFGTQVKWEAYQICSLYREAMQMREVIDEKVFINNLKEAYKAALERREKFATKGRPNKYTPEKAKSLCLQHGASVPNKKYGPLAVDLFGDKIISIKVPKIQSAGSNFQIELLLRSEDFKTQCDWVKSNVKKLNKFVGHIVKQEFPDFGGLYKCYDISILRSSVLVYQFELKKEVEDLI